jgi:hypothetical protein
MTASSQIVRRLDRLEELLGAGENEDKLIIEIVAVSSDGTVCHTGKVIEVPLGGKGGKKTHEH